MTKRIICLLILVSSFSNFAKADGGMWLPFLMKNEQFAKMRKAGLKLSAEEIYSVNQACLKDAIIGLTTQGSDVLRSFATGSFVSDKGLIITNYHSIMNYVARFTTEDNNFLKHGYWASKPSEESRLRDLMVKKLVRMEDITEEIKKGTEGLTGSEYVKKINENGAKIADKVTKGTNLKVRLQTLFANNQYIMSVYQLFKDVRLVAAPPTVISRFGGTTDNWNWPRFTGDFAFLRVYAGDKNQPKNYNIKNVPYKPQSKLKISLKGVEENDFTMVMGYPSNTNFYIPSFGIKANIEERDVILAKMQGTKYNIIKNEIAENPHLLMRYSTTLSAISNSYIKNKGEILGARRTDLVNIKTQEDEAFQRWADSSPSRKAKYGKVLDNMRNVYKSLSVYNYAYDLLSQAGLNGAEIVPYIGKFEKLIIMHTSKKPLKVKQEKNERKRLIGLTKQFFRNWSYTIDRKIYSKMLTYYYANAPKEFYSADVVKYIKDYNGNVDSLINDMFANSIFTKEKAVLDFLNSDNQDVVGLMYGDPLYKTSISFYKIFVNRINRDRVQLQRKMLKDHKLYVEGLLEMNNGKTLPPDANGSFRYAYGHVMGAEPEDAVSYRYYTTLDGLVEKSINNSDNYEYDLSPRLKKLYERKDFGKFAAKDGKIHTSFLTNTQTAAGNSGSPVLNAKGELVGINFDRIWQGVISDFRYDPNGRNISVDIRYIMYLLKDYAPNRYVFDEIPLED